MSSPRHGTPRQNSAEIFRAKQFSYTLGDLEKDSIKKEKAHPTYKDVNYFAFELHARKLLEKLL